MANPNIQFTRSRKGYDPQEVDAVMTELQKQLADLNQRNDSLSNAIAQYDSEVRRLAEGTKQLQEERMQESLRMNGLMNVAAKMAEEAKREALNQANETIENARRETVLAVENARREVERIRSQAQTEMAAAKAALTKLSEYTARIRQSNEQYTLGANAQISVVDVLIHNALSGLPYTASSQPLPLTPPAQAEQNIPHSAEPLPPVPAADPYEDFVKTLKEMGQQPKYPQN